MRLRSELSVRASRFPLNTPKMGETSLYPTAGPQTRNTLGIAQHGSAVTRHKNLENFKARSGYLLSTAILVQRGVGTPTPRRQGSGGTQLHGLAANLSDPGPRPSQGVLTLLLSRTASACLPALLTGARLEK
jgi:hypothetical protein